MSTIKFEHVTKHFDGASAEAVSDVSFTVEEGEFITILGTSGCGKTTLMRMVNGLILPSGGKITVLGEELGRTDAVRLRRKIGYVIQQIGLFPHMTVEKNIATVPELLGWERERIKARVAELLELVNLDPKEFAGRYPARLSGGQQQRVGLARALAADPPLLLMDEPFGAIDAINRTRLQDELLEIHKKSRKTILFVTHDVTEALKLGSRVMIMNEGKIQQFDRPDRILSSPSGSYVKELLDSVRLSFSSLEEREV